MFANLSQREKIMIYILIGLIAIFALFKYAWLIQRDVYQQAKTNYQMLNTKAELYRNQVQTLNALKQEENTLQIKLSKLTKPYKIDLMGGEQIREIGKIIENSGLKVAVAAPIKTDAQADYYTQDIKFQVQGTYGALEQFFYDTEYSSYAFIIKKFTIAPKNTKDKDPSLVGLNYNDLNADLIVTVIGDKAAKVKEPSLESFKTDLFKPTQADMEAMRELEQAKAAENLPPEQQGNTPPGEVYSEAVPVATGVEETPATPEKPENENGYKVDSENQDKEYTPSYSFQKK